MRIWGQREMWRERKRMYAGCTDNSGGFEAFDPATGTHEQARQADATGCGLSVENLTCHQCERDVFLAVEVGQAGEYENCATLCRECLNAASELLAKAETQTL